MMAMQQTFPTKGPLAAFGMVMLLSLTACGKVTEPQSYQLPPAKQIAETGSISGRVTLIGGIPADLNQAIDVGGNPFCSNHAGLTNPTWRLSKDGGLADVVVSLKLADRAANLAVPAPLIDQSHCEFVPHLTVLQAGQSVTGNGILVGTTITAVDAANNLMADLRSALPGLPGQRFGARSITLADDFAYADPVDKSISKAQGIRLIFDDGARVIFRLSGTGTEGATLRLYLERYESDPALQDVPVQLALHDLAVLADQVAAIARHTGMDGPSVAT